MAAKSKEKIYFTVKGVLDVILAIVGGVLSLPIIVVAAIAIKLDSKGPVLADTPKRVGKGGKLFQLYKFRSMIPNAHYLLHHDPKFKKLYEKYKNGSYKTGQDDPRVTKVGKFIRKYSIDEVPQIINVLKGEMSIVGPRAYYPDEIANQRKIYPETTDKVDEALSIKPGITGLWQVSGRSNVNFDKRIVLDAYYANKKSLVLDFLILLKTPWVVLSGQGAV